MIHVVSRDSSTYNNIPTNEHFALTLTESQERHVQYIKEQVQARVQLQDFPHCDKTSEILNRKQNITGSEGNCHINSGLNK